MNGVRYLKFLFFIVFVLNLHSSIIHEEPPYFIQNYPLILEVSFSEKEKIKLVQIVYKFPEQAEFSISTMTCQWNKCKTIIPTHQAYYLEYYIQIEFYPNKIIRSKTMKIYRVAIPAWQDIPQSGVLNLFGNKQELKGFYTDEVLIQPIEENKNKLKKDGTKKISTSKKEVKSEGWINKWVDKISGFFNFFDGFNQDANEQTETDESSETFQDEKQIFTP
jgi:excinuclease UvrABC ATPase subunit